MEEVWESSGNPTAKWGQQNSTNWQQLINAVILTPTFKKLYLSCEQQYNSVK